MFNTDPNDLRAERGELIKKMKSMLTFAQAHNRDLTAKEAKTYDELNERVDGLLAQAERLERVGALEEHANQLKGPFHRNIPENEYGEPMSSGKARKPEWKANAERFFRTGQVNNALQIGVDSDGGFTISEQFDRDLFGTLAEMNPIFRDAERVTTASNNYVRIYSQGGADAGRVDENATRTETGGIDFDKVKIDLSMLYATVNVTEELLMSSEYDLAGHVQREVELGFNSTLESEFLDGDGSGTAPTGILHAADSTDADGTRAFGSYQVLDAAATDAITFDEVVKLLHALKPEYRRGAKLYCSTEVVESLRLLKDGNQLPIWREGEGVVGRPQSLLGVEVVEVPAMPGLAAENKALIFGNLSRGYIFASHVNGTRMTRDPYSQLGIVRLYSRLFSGAGPSDTKAIKVLRLAS